MSYMPYGCMICKVRVLFKTIRHTEYNLNQIVLVINPLLLKLKHFNPFYRKTKIIEINKALINISH